MSIEPFRKLTSRTIVLHDENIDTDQIIPARFLTTTGRSGLGEACFHDWRFDRSGQPTGHVLNVTDFGTHRILVAGDNFGCGSSREHAPWALLALGVRCVISTGIADIFRANAMKNGLLPVCVPPDVHARMLERPGVEMTVDLADETILFEREIVGFTTEPFARRCLLEGRDSLDVLLAAIPDIEAYEAQRP